MTFEQALLHNVEWPKGGGFLESNSLIGNPALTYIDNMTFGKLYNLLVLVSSVIKHRAC